MNNDPYIVETIVKKRFSKVQYEYLIKRVGYSSAKHVGASYSNIPPEMLDAQGKRITGAKAIRSKDKKINHQRKTVSTSKLSLP